MDAINEQGNTPLILSIRDGNAEIVEMVAQRVKALCHRNSQGLSALDTARTLGDSNIVDILQTEANKRGGKSERAAP